jgi:microcystin-dependent protein
MEAIYASQIMLWAGTWAPDGWLLCNGQQVLIREYPALFSLIGFNYSPGYSQTTFNLPNFGGIVLAGTGHGVNLNNNYPLGKTITGAEMQPISQVQVSPHQHTPIFNFSPSGLQTSLVVSTATATSSTPDTLTIPAAGATNDNTVNADLYVPSSSPVQLKGSVFATMTANIPYIQVLPSTGTGSPHNNMQPYLVLNYIINWNGPYPTFP